MDQYYNRLQSILFKLLEKRLLDLRIRRNISRTNMTTRNNRPTTRNRLTDVRLYPKSTEVMTAVEFHKTVNSNTTPRHGQRNRHNGNACIRRGDDCSPPRTASQSPFQRYANTDHYTSPDRTSTLSTTLGKEQKSSQNGSLPSNPS